MEEMTGEVQHGYSTYTNGRCRCGVCRAAKAAYMAHRRAEARRLAREAGPGFVAIGGRHGTAYAYDERGCHCEPCRAAANRWKGTPALRAAKRAAAS